LPHYTIYSRSAIISNYC